MHSRLYGKPRYQFVAMLINDKFNAINIARRQGYNKTQLHYLITKGINLGDIESFKIKLPVMDPRSFISRQAIVDLKRLASVSGARGLADLDVNDPLYRFGGYCRRINNTWLNEFSLKISHNVSRSGATYNTYRFQNVDADKHYKNDAFVAMPDLGLPKRSDGSPGEHYRYSRFREFLLAGYDLDSAMKYSRMSPFPGEELSNDYLREYFRLRANDYYDQEDVILNYV
ncbi:hypothetical protein [Limosilactobacillus antri]|uniref:hypothetical protein n=1 Tax=Limosilactobacillus antri TaxID=227943 RepID=UPI001F5602D4|nr:hypothetical protein [Limosilactobacillus antri]